MYDKLIFLKLSVQSKITNMLIFSNKTDDLKKIFLLKTYISNDTF